MAVIFDPPTKEELLDNLTDEALGEMIAQRPTIVRFLASLFSEPA